MSVETYIALDKRVDAAEGDGIFARWEFGRELLAERVGKQLPKGRLDEIAKAIGKSRQEIGHRLKFASDYRTEIEVSNAIRNFGSWFAIVNRPQAPQAPADPGPLPDRTYRTIAADPPWQYGNSATRGAAEDHYRTMTIPELCAIDVAKLAAPDAHLYLWTTNGFLREAFEVVEAWGFTYKTCLTWVKPQIGMGNYFRSVTEHIYFATRGRLPITDRTLRNYFEAPRGKHSAKPDKFYDLAEVASPGPRLEMFARRRRLGWDVWGDEA